MHSVSKKSRKLMTFIISYFMSIVSTSIRENLKISHVAAHLKPDVCNWRSLKECAYLGIETSFFTAFETPVFA